MDHGFLQEEDRWSCVRVFTRSNESCWILRSPASCSSRSSPHPRRSCLWKSSTFETRAFPPSLGSNLRPSSPPALSSPRSSLLPSRCSLFSLRFYFLSTASPPRMTWFRRFPMGPSQCSTAIPEPFGSSPTRSAASPNTRGTASFRVLSDPASSATCSGCRRSCGERKASRFSISSRALLSKGRALRAFCEAPARKMCMAVRSVGSCGIKSLFLRKETQWNTVF